MKDEKLYNICLEIYKQMYKESTPSADLDKLIESGESKKKNWFFDYYLREERQSEIMNDTFKKYGGKLSKLDRSKIRTEVYLGCSPTSVIT